MARLYDMVQRIDQIIRDRDLPVFITKGKIAMKTGFVLSMVDTRTPDDPQHIEELARAAAEVLGVEL